MSSTVGTMGRVTTRGRRLPSKGWYWLAIAIIVAGVAGGVAWGVTSTLTTHDRAQSMPRTGVPGALQVPLQAGSSQLIYFEGGDKPSPAALGLTVTGPDGASVPVQPYDLLMQYEIAGWLGSPVASFSAPIDGTYKISAGKTYGNGDISVGDNFVRDQAIDVVGALALIAASCTAGVVILIVVAVKRSRRRAVALS